MKQLNKVALNSLALYINMIISMVMTLLGTRYVLEALGKNDYGIYVLIANIVAMFSFLNVAMAASSQRYLSYAMGGQDFSDLKETFYNSFLIHGILAFAMCFVLYILGTFSIYNILELTVNDLPKAHSVLICMVVGIFFTILSVPYDAALNAREDIFLLAIINITEATLKLLSAIAILYISSEKLIFYAIAITSISFISLFCKWFLCRRYKECKITFHRIKNFNLIKKMLSFAGWNLIGTGCSIARYQGAAVLLNIFFGIIVNAAYGIAQQLNGFLLFFANSTVRPMRPQIIKSEGAGAHERMVSLSFSTSRISTLLLLLIIIPLHINMPYILDIWLIEVPPHTIEFCRLFLWITLAFQVSIGLSVALEGVGKIKRQQLIIGSMHIISLPIGFLLFYLGYEPQSILYCVLIEECLSTLLRAYIAERDAQVSMRTYIKSVFIPCSICTALTLIFASTPNYFLQLNPFTSLALTTLISTITITILGYTVCLTKWEKQKIYTLVCSSFAKKL